jgi:hypothetical protein
LPPIPLPGIGIPVKVPTFPSAACLKLECSHGKYCIGSDKIGHFLELGYMLFQVAMEFYYDRGWERAEAFSRWTEGFAIEDKELREWLEKKSFDFFGHKERRLRNYRERWGDLGILQRSAADLAANRQGMRFWFDLRKALRNGKIAGNVRDPGDYWFDICDYVDKQWEEWKWFSSSIPSIEETCSEMCDWSHGK